jgi:hypothetical protein
MPWPEEELHDQVCENVVRYELTHPGTMWSAVYGDGAAMAAIYALVDRNTVSILDNANTVFSVRVSKDEPRIRTTSMMARAVARISNRRNWSAHHLIPFNVVCSLPQRFKWPSPTLDGGWTCLKT